MLGFPLAAKFVASFPLTASLRRHVVQVVGPAFRWGDWLEQLSAVEFIQLQMALQSLRDPQQEITTAGTDVCYALLCAAAVERQRETLDPSTTELVQLAQAAEVCIAREELRRRGLLYLEERQSLTRPRASRPYLAAQLHSLPAAAPGF